MKHIIFFLFILSFFSSCKKENEKVQTCENNKAPLTIDYQDWGTVKHPVSDSVFFSESFGSIAPSQSINGLIKYRDISISIDDGPSMSPDNGLNYVNVDSLDVGIHKIEMNLNCEKTLFNDTEQKCECSGNETNAELEIEVVAPVHIVFDSIIYSKNLPCTYDFPLLPCPDTEFNFSYYGSDDLYYIKNQYNYSDNGPILAALGDTIAIYPNECTIPLSIDDDDPGNNSVDHIEDYELTPSNMGQWNTGSYQIGSYLRIVITRL